MSKKFVSPFLKNHDYERTVKFLEINPPQKPFFRRVVDLMLSLNDLDRAEKREKKKFD